MVTELFRALDLIELNVRSYNEQTRMGILDAVRRIVTAECQASRSPKDPFIELFDRFPPTHNDPDTTQKVRAAFVDFFGDRAQALLLKTDSEDFRTFPSTTHQALRPSFSPPSTLERKH